jgi:nucleolin
MAEDSRKLFVAGLPDSISEDVLRQLFEATGGSVAEVSLPKDRATGRPRGFGFVTMSTTEAANVAREALHGSFQGGRSISVRPFESAPPKREGGPPSGPRSSAGGPPTDSPDRKIYIGNLPYDATPEEVEAVVNGTGAGPVVRVIMPADPDGRRRGFAFAYMASVEAARGALDLLKGVEVRGRRLVINQAHDRPPRDDRGFGGGPPSGPRSDYGGGGGGFGGPPRDFGPPAGGAPGAPGPGAGDRRVGGGGAPPQGRKTFDERRKKTHDDGGGGGGRGRRNKNDWDTRDDWGKDE